MSERSERIMSPATDAETPAQAQRNPDEPTADDEAEDLGLYPDPERKTFSPDYYS